MAIDVVSLVIALVLQILFWLIVVGPALWISGRLLAGKGKAKFSDALWIVIIGTIVFYFVNMALTGLFADFTNTLFGSLISYLVLLLIWLALVKHFFDCGWLKALAISIIAVIIAVVIWLIIGILLALIGFSSLWIPNSVNMF
ncbi:MAG: hypothetical protein ACQCN4_01265 [Candidatus Bathyarchaeia archaeon]|jgi:hypothetical protein